MRLTGHTSRAIFDRYNIINEQELLAAGDQLVAYLAQHAQATPRGGRPTRPAPPLRAPRRRSASCDAPARKGGPPERLAGGQQTHRLPQTPLAGVLARGGGNPAHVRPTGAMALPEDAILLPEIVDAIFLVAIHPASQGQHEEVQSVGHGLRLHGSDTAVTHVV